MSAAVRCIERGEFLCDSPSKYVCQFNSDMLLIAGLLLAVMSVSYGCDFVIVFLQQLRFVTISALDLDPRLFGFHFIWIRIQYVRFL
jgi:hypothetical protein